MALHAVSVDVAAGVAAWQIICKCMRMTFQFEFYCPPSSLNYLEPDSCRHDESCILSSRHTHALTHARTVSCSLETPPDSFPRPFPACVFQFDIKPFRAFAHIAFLFMQSAGVPWSVCVCLCGTLCASACVCVCLGVVVGQVEASGKRISRLFPPHIKINTSKCVLASYSGLGSAFTQLGLLSHLPAPLANEANVPFYVAHAGVRKNKNSLNFKSFFPVFLRSVKCRKSFRFDCVWGGK